MKRKNVVAIILLVFGGLHCDIDAMKRKAEIDSSLLNVVEAKILRGDFDENSIYVARVAEEVYPAIMKRTNNTESKIKRYHCFLCNSSFMTEKSKKRHERTSKKHLDLVGLDR